MNAELAPTEYDEELLQKSLCARARENRFFVAASGGGVYQTTSAAAAASAEKSTGGVETTERQDNAFCHLTLGLSGWLRLRLVRKSPVRTGRPDGWTDGRMDNAGTPAKQVVEDDNAHPPASRRQQSSDF